MDWWWVLTDKLGPRSVVLCRCELNQTIGSECNGRLALTTQCQQHRMLLPEATSCQFFLFFIIFSFLNFEQSGILVMWPTRDQVMWPSRVAYPGMAFLIVVFLSTRDPWAIITHWTDMADHVRRCILSCLLKQIFLYFIVSFKKMWSWFIMQNIHDDGFGQWPGSEKASSYCINT